MSTSVKQQRKGVLRLMFLALAIFLLSLATRKDEPAPEPPPVPQSPPEEVRIEPRTWAPGERVALPAPGDETRAEDCLHAWWMKDPVLSRAEFQRDESGLFLLDHRDVPEGVLSCFASSRELATMVENETLTLQF